MPITIAGSGTITGISAGGLPDASIVAGDLASNAVTTAKVADANITAAKIGYAGAILQMVSTTFSSEFSWTTKGSWVDMTGISATITPTRASSKILIQVMLCTGDGGNNYCRGYRVVRNGSVFIEGPNTGSIIARAQASTPPPGNDAVTMVPIIVHDSPGTTSAVTYKLQGWASSSSVTTSYINRPYTPNTANSFTGVSTITLTEVST